MFDVSQQLRKNVWWLREPSNPVLPLGAPGTFDSTSCMNPYVLRHGDDYYLYYAGGDDDGHRRICLATAPVAKPTEWERHGPLFDIGTPGSFDANWCVLPHVVQFAPDQWHLYYTSNSGVGKGLSAFPGIGLAISSDGKHWQKYDQNPVLTRTGRDGDPDAKGIAGGSVIKATMPDGTTEWRFYYTGCPALGDDLFLDQQKCCCLAVSQDGIHWEKRGAVMFRNPAHDYENVAVAGPVVHQEEDGSYRMWYSAIGTRWGAYSIAYAESDDGLVWRRGIHYGDNLQLGPIGRDWDSQMVEYPAVIREDERLRLFYCGNGYGSTGTGTALSSPLRATVTEQVGEADIVAAEGQLRWRYSIPALLRCTQGIVADANPNTNRWHGPDAKGMLWYEWTCFSPQGELGHNETDPTATNTHTAQGIQCRVMLTPAIDGLEVSVTVMNGSDQALDDLTMRSQCKQTSPSEEDANVVLCEQWETVGDVSVVANASGSESHDDHRFAAVALGKVEPGITLTARGKVLLSSVHEYA